MATHKKKFITRDISWLAFNARVLQEAADPTVPLKERIRFLGIFSNNLDEFFRVRVATLKRMIELGKKAKAVMHLESSPQKILDIIQVTVLQQQNEFHRIWESVLEQLNNEKIFIITEKELNREQQKYVETFFEEEVRSNVIPLMIQSIPQFPNLRDKSIYLAVVMSKKESAYGQKFALVEVPRTISRFVLLPSREGEQSIILMEDVVRYCLPQIFSFFGYDRFSSHIIKVTRDAEIDIDNDISTSFVQKIQKGLKNRKKGKPVRFIYDKEIDPGLLEYLIRRMNLSRRDNLIPGGRIHNFRNFMDFPDSVFKTKNPRRKPFSHPLLQNSFRVTDAILKKDVLLNFPYHSFAPVIDLLREAAIDPEVISIKITAYRLAANSKIVNALINAVRNGKQVTVMLELRARFEEEANLEWKERLEDEGVKVLLGLPSMKVHAKLCLIKKRLQNKTIHYGFVSTGNLNEKTALLYADHCLLTANRNVMADVNRIFSYLEKPKTALPNLMQCKTLLVSPLVLRRELNKMVDREIRNARHGKKAAITLKMNSLSDELLISKLYEAATVGVEIKMVVRGIFCMYTESKKFKTQVKSISIVDEYLEHARVMIFHNGGKEKVYISSADWMVRNIDHRVECACPIIGDSIAKELKDIIEIQLRDNVKARVLDNALDNVYVRVAGKKVRSQIEIYNYLMNKTPAGSVGKDNEGA